MTVEFLLAFFISFGLAVFITPIVRYLALHLRVMDVPRSERQIQTQPVPKLGGLSVYLGFALTAVLWLALLPGSFGEYIEPRAIFGLVIGGAALIMGGYWDDRYSLPPVKQIVFPLLAATCILVSGVQLSYINNPFGGAILLDTFKISGYPVLGGMFVFFWLLGMMYTTKFLDGMDGLVSGVSAIGAVVLFFVSLMPAVHQPDTALLASMFAGALLGFLPWNFHPAKIFLGEGGSTFAGFVLGSLAIISGGKIATALLIMGIPILDVAWVIVRRLTQSFSPFQGDRKHLHFRLLDIGLTQRQTVLFLYILSAGFGLSGLYLQAVGKVIALLILCGVMAVLAILLVAAYNQKIKKQNTKIQS